MKFIDRPILVSLVLTGALCCSGWADNTVATPAAGSGRIVELKAAELEVPSTDLAPALTRPSRVEQQPVSLEIKAQLQRFETAREAYLQKQKELSLQLKGAGDEQRKLIRKQLEGLRSEWVDRARQFRQEARPMFRELPKYEALDAKKPAAVDLKRDRQLK